MRYFCSRVDWTLFFENSNEEKIVVNQSNYQNMLENYFLPKLCNRVGNRFDEQILCKLARHLIRLRKRWIFGKFFGEKIISIKSEDIWPPYCPDLNPCDYFLWGFLKDRVFSENIGNVSILK